MYTRIRLLNHESRALVKNAVLVVISAPLLIHFLDMSHFFIGTSKIQHGLGSRLLI